MSAIGNEEALNGCAYQAFVSQPGAIPIWAERDRVSLSTLVELKDATIAYGGQAVFENPNWAIRPMSIGRLLVQMVQERRRFTADYWRSSPVLRQRCESLWFQGLWREYLGCEALHRSYPLRFKWRTGCRHRLSAHCSQVFMTRSVCIKGHRN